MDETSGILISKAVPKIPRIVKPEKHTHDADCMLAKPFDEDDFRETNPLLIPVFLGWQRNIIQENCASWKVEYEAPCGFIAKDEEELSKFLTECSNSVLHINFFSFHPWVREDLLFLPSNVIVSIRDITYGKENVAIPYVNNLDTSFIPYFEYNTELMPQKDVYIPDDPGFLVCCDCEDDCANSSTCQCQQLTIEMTRNGKGWVEPSAVYRYRQLRDVVPSGIYECNSRCACNRTCYNRVAQQPPHPRIQVFKTVNRGFGIRALVDIPQGTFICSYVGKVYTSEEGNIHGELYGDSYFADLDLIENLERNKEGYESDVEDIEEEIKREDGQLNDKSVPTSKDASTPAAKERKSKFVSVRKFFGPKESVYIVDALTAGNVGRYMNHSCDPNIMVQNVFINTHDLRFPQISFFTCKFVQAGEELCWNYSYEVGSVPGKEIMCYCSKDICTKRLL